MSLERIPQKMSSQQTAELVTSIREATRHLDKARSLLQVSWCYSCQFYRAGPDEEADCAYWGVKIPVEHRATGCDHYETEVPF